MKKLTALLFFTLILYAQMTPTTFNKTVASAGTAVRLIANNTIVKSASIQALGSNTGRVCFGDSATLASSYRGTCLTAGQAGPLFSVANPASQPFDLSAFFIDSSVNGEGVSVTYYAQ